MYHIITRVTAFGEKRKAQGDEYKVVRRIHSSNSATDNNNKNTTCVYISVYICIRWTLQRLTFYDC